jgi:tetratricopeptide (TPR) repeat protein
MLDLAKVNSDADLLIEGHGLACGSYCYAGEFTKAVEHADKVLELYDDPEKDRHLAYVVNRKTRAGIYSSVSTWMLGYPDRALRLNNEKDERARRRGHPVDIGVALTMGAHEFDHRYDHKDLRMRAEECERLGRENSLPFLWAILAPLSHGLALIREGKHVEAIALLKPGIATWEASGGGVKNPTWKAFLVEAMALTGYIDNAIHLIDAIIAQIERPEWDERLHYAEILRLKGWMLSLKGDLEGAERNFVTSLEWARRQQAKSWELRTSISLARLWQSQGKCQDAHELLAPVYSWFTEGFDTKDLLDAKALLDELG